MGINLSTVRHLTPDQRRAIIRRLVQIGLTLLLEAAILFGAAGRLDWINAWALLALSAGIVVFNALVMPPELIAERAGPREGRKAWDRILGILWAPTLLGGLAAAGLDRRFGWTPALPLAVLAGGAALHVLGSLLFTWAMVSNPYFSTVVRIQADRGHTVQTGGPYRIVRHPGYVGYLITWIGTPLLLGSLWALIASALIALILVARTVLEDRTLRAELPGYAEYAQQVRYRLLPGVW